MSGRKLVHVTENRQRIGNVAECQIRIERLNTDLAKELGMFPQRLQLRTEDQRAARGDRVIERLLPHTIACEKERAGVGVPDGESKHAAQMIDTASAIFFVSMNNRFRV